MTNEDGVVTELQLRRETLENPNSFVMDFYKATIWGTICIFASRAVEWRAKRYHFPNTNQKRSGLAER